MSTEIEATIRENAIAMIGHTDVIKAVAECLEEHGIIGINNRQMNAIIEGTRLIMDELDQPHRAATPGMGLANWFVCDETGRSSMYLGRTLQYIQNRWTGPERHFENYSPRDPSDFGRCVGLLDAAPELREHLPKMAEGHGPVWAALAAAWTELEALYREEKPSGKCPKLMARMDDIYKQAEEQAHDNAG